MQSSRFGRAALLSIAILLLTANARAFCRTRTCESDPNVSCEPIDGCSTVGPTVSWRSRCLRYAVQRDGSPKLGIESSTIQTLLADELGHWSSAACDGSLTPAFRAQSQGDVVCDAVEFNCGAGPRNLNVVMFVDQGWEHSPAEIALTTVSIGLDTGEILDVDVEVNSERYELVIDPPSGSTATDLRMVLAHEMGHFLGLSHSNDPTALMRVGGTSTPDLKPDDVAGVCAIFPAAATDPICAAPASAEGAACVGSKLVCEAPPEEGCGCRFARTHAGFAAAAAGAFVLAAARLRRRCRSGSASSATAV